MGLFDRFRREKSYNTTEVDKYYDQPKHRNPIVAILLGILAFLVTLAVLWLLFLGGRWVYRQIMGNESSQPSNTAQTAESKQAEGGSSINTNNDGKTSSTSTNKPSSGSSQSQSGQQSSGSSSAQSGSQATTPALGDNPTLPHTGDEGL